jgi:hypothetical protein
LSPRLVKLNHSGHSRQGHPRLASDRGERIPDIETTTHSHREGIVGDLQGQGPRQLRDLDREHGLGETRDPEGAVRRQPSLDLDRDHAEEVQSRVELEDEGAALGDESTRHLPTDPEHLQFPGQVDHCGRNSNPEVLGIPGGIDLDVTAARDLDAIPEAEIQIHVRSHREDPGSIRLLPDHRLGGHPGQPERLEIEVHRQGQRRGIPAEDDPCRALEVDESGNREGASECDAEGLRLDRPLLGPRDTTGGVHHEERDPTGRRRGVELHLECPLQAEARGVHQGGGRKDPEESLPIDPGEPPHHGHLTDGQLGPSLERQRGLGRANLEGEGARDRQGVRDPDAARTPNGEGPRLEVERLR